MGRGIIRLGNDRVIAMPFCPECHERFDSGVQFCPADGAALTVQLDSENLVGTVIDARYEVLERLGSGGMGNVYVARQSSVGRLVALKMLKRHLLQNVEVGKRFFLEAKAASRLTNPHTITIYDFGVAPDGRLYIAMELLRGRSLRDLLDEQGALPAGEALGIIEAVGDSLGEAHALGIVHRDVKPENIFLAERAGDDPTVKVLDFGVARAQSLHTTPITQRGFATGTPAYMAPETVVGEEVDGRADVYAMGGGRGRGGRGRSNALPDPRDTPTIRPRMKATAPRTRRPDLHHHLHRLCGLGPAGAYGDTPLHSHPRRGHDLLGLGRCVLEHGSTHHRALAGHPAVRYHPLMAEADDTTFLEDDVGAFN